MEPVRHIKLVARDRARRVPVGRPVLLPIQKPQSDHRPASSDASATSPAADAAPQRNPAVRAFLIAMIVMVGLTFGGMLGLIGWPMLQAAGIVDPPVVETVQRRQAETISQLETTVNALNATVQGMGVRVDAATAQQDAVGRRMTDLDSALGALRTGVDEVRAAQNAANESWREPVAELAAAAAKTRSEVTRLRSSLDEFTRARSSEGPRAERSEQQTPLQRSLRTSIRVPADPQNAVAEGHIINLPSR